MSDNAQSNPTDEISDDCFNSAANLINTINNISEIKSEEDLNLSELFQMQLLTSSVIALLPFKIKEMNDSVQNRLEKLEQKMKDLFTILKDLVKIQQTKKES